jgi:hypothetical protein
MEIARAHSQRKREKKKKTPMTSNSPAMSIQPKSRNSPMRKESKSKAEKNPRECQYHARPRTRIEDVGPKLKIRN